MADWRDALIKARHDEIPQDALLDVDELGGVIA